MNPEIQRVFSLARRELASSRSSFYSPSHLRLLRRAFLHSAPITTSQRSNNQVHSSLANNSSKPTPVLAPSKNIQLRELPVCCPGCGALTQSEHKDEAGYFTVSRKGVQNYMKQDEEDDIFRNTFKNISAEELKSLGVENAPKTGVISSLKATVDVPYCDRCHNLQHHSIGVPIEHPSLQAIEATISESPHKSNHIWHVIDAADFPMSLILNIDQKLSLAHVRTRNRRSRDKKYVRGGPVDMSFIVTRSDLLAPKKEQIDKLLPKLREILRQKLGAFGKNFRMGNLHVVSAERGWWTKAVKEKISQGAGANWLVGKVNVGKSKLFETIFPKGSNKETNIDKLHEEAKLNATQTDVELLAAAAEKNQIPADMSQSRTDWSDESGSTVESSEDQSSSSLSETAFQDQFSLLPPVQPLTQYPVMPVISGLPGTTASPIRVPFQNGGGELIDLPGLARGTLEQYVRPDARSKLVMTSRVAPERYVMKPGSSLLLGGLIRIKPKTHNTIIMAHSFTPLPSHLTSDIKAEAIHNGQLEANIDTVVEPDARSRMASAGIFQLNTEVTRAYSGPLTRRDAVGLKPERLPFTMYGTDILIEGVGWVELIAQVRKPKTRAVQQKLLPLEKQVLDLELGGDGFMSEEPDSLSPFPEVEIFSPEGKFIGERPSLCAYSLGHPLKEKVGKRPRRSMRSVRGRLKAEKRAAVASARSA